MSSVELCPDFGREEVAASEPIAVAAPFAESSSRLACVDLLRGAAMILMALDHTRDFLTGVHFAPEDLSAASPALFFMRWVTHFCAPVFFLLAGTGGYLALSRGKSVAQVSRFFWSRGLFLVALNLVAIGFAWTSTFPFLMSDVLWALGWSMVAMSFLMRLPVPVIAALGGGVVAAHNLLDPIRPAAFGKFGGLWMILHGHGSFWIVPGKLSFFVLWPLIPWVGVTAAGYALGSLLVKSNRRGTVFAIGAALTITFCMLRAFHLYGNGETTFAGVAGGPWVAGPTLPLTVASFFDTSKYPPSLQFLLMTLGPALMALAWLGRVNVKIWLAKVVLVFGRVPLFFYVLHLFVIHALAVYVAMATHQRAAWLEYGGPMRLPPPPGYGHGLPFIYAVWLGLLVLLYPVCWWYARFKNQHADWRWLEYL